MSGTCAASRRTRRARPRSPASRPAVEALAHRESVRRGPAPYRKRLVSSSTSAPARVSAAGQRVVVGRRVGRRIDELHAHGGAFYDSPRAIGFRRWSRAAWSAPSSPLLVLRHGGRVLRHPALKTDVPVVLRFAVDSARTSRRTATGRDSLRVGFDLSEPAEVSFSIVDEEGKEVATACRRPRAGRRRQVPLPLGRPRRRGQGGARRRATGCGWSGASRASRWTRSRR